MQAIIPVAGAGARLRPLTYTQPKVLISVAGKPILSFIIEQLQSIGVTRFVVVLGYLGEKIKDYIDEHYPNLDVEYVSQEHREGLGHAIWCAREKVNMLDDLVIHLGDTIVETDFNRVIRSNYSTLCIKKVEDPRKFGVAELDQEGFIVHLAEKPVIPKSNMAMVGFYYIKETAALFDELDKNVDSDLRTNNQFQLTDALLGMMKRGIRMKGHAVENWFDLGKKEILLETNANLLKKSGDMSRDQGIIENSIVVPPVSIAADAVIRNSIVGPYVTIGEKTELNHSIVRNSIIGSYARLEEVVLQNSMIGSDASVRGSSQSLNIGDNTEIDLRGENNQ